MTFPLIVFFGQVFFFKKKWLQCRFPLLVQKSQVLRNYFIGMNLTAGMVLKKGMLLDLKSEVSGRRRRILMKNEKVSSVKYLSYSMEYSVLKRPLDSFKRQLEMGYHSCMDFLVIICFNLDLQLTIFLS